MNRTIKFRAWDKDERRMTKSGMASILDLRRDRFEIMEFTGLRDNNGTEIYEGDIVRILEGIPEALRKSYGPPQKVRWDADKAAWAPQMSHLTKWAKVVGNIYENPELVKESA